MVVAINLRGCVHPLFHTETCPACHLHHMGHTGPNSKFVHIQQDSPRVNVLNCRGLYMNCTTPKLVSHSNFEHSN